ncbi:hypothetical protein ACFOW1_09550 [Parasediminibacterium paludis]|uniref:Uncharacterized protein n=1 Tax=Parasediminibacterium paludis TaxID=908966 RepID=A0ABV8PZ90_9BACT
MNVVTNKWVNLVIGSVAIAGSILLALVIKEAIDKHKKKTTTITDPTAVAPVK